MMIISRKLVCSIILITHTMVSAGQVSPITNIDTDPKTVSLGFVDMVSDCVGSAAFANPATMSFYDFKTAVTFSYCYWQPSAFKDHRSFISGSYKINDKLAIASGLAYGVGQSYEMYGNDAEYIGSYTPMDFYFKAGASYKILPFMSLGVNVGLVNNLLTSKYSNMAFMADLFVMSSFSDFKITVGGRNLGFSWTSAGTIQDELSLLASMGVSYEKMFNVSHNVGLYAQYDFMSVDEMSASLGSLYSYKNIFTIRAGGRLGYGKVQSLMSLGFGVMLKPVEFNIAYILPVCEGTLSNTMCLSIVYRI